MSVAMFTKYLLKALAISCNSVRLQTLSKILEGAILNNSFKEISLFIPFHILLKTFRLFWKY